MIKVTTLGSHALSQELGAFARTLLTCSCGTSFQMVCKATFNSSIVFVLQREFVVLFQHGARYVIVSGFNKGPMILSNEPRRVRLQPVLRDARRVSWGAVLLEDETLTACVTANVVTLIICTKGPFTSLYPYFSTTQNPAVFRTTTHITGVNVRYVQK